MLFLVISVLLTAKVSLGETSCESLFCERPAAMESIPKDASSLREYCAAAKPHLRCQKRFQDECPERRVVFFSTPEIYQAMYSTVSEVCEEGTLLNTVAVQNIRCLNETFGRTRCLAEADEFLRPSQSDDSEPKFNYFCMHGVLVHDCVIRAISENCGRIAGEASADFFRRAKSLDQSCSLSGAKSVQDELDNLNLSEDKKRSTGHLLQKLVEDNTA